MDSIMCMCVSVCSFVCEIPVIPVAKMIIPTICPLAPWHSIPASSSCTHHTHTDTHCSTGAITQELGRLVPREGSPWSATELAHCPWRKKWRYRLAKHTDKRLETKNRGGWGWSARGCWEGQMPDWFDWSGEERRKTAKVKWKQRMADKQKTEQGWK